MSEPVGVAELELRLVRIPLRNPFRTSFGEEGEASPRDMPRDDDDDGAPSTAGPSVW